MCFTRVAALAEHELVECFLERGAREPGCRSDRMAAEVEVAFEELVRLN